MGKERTLPVPTRLASELRHRPVGWLLPGGVEGYCGVDFVAKRIRTATGWPSHSLTATIRHRQLLPKRLQHRPGQSDARPLQRCYHHALHRSGPEQNENHD